MSLESQLATLITALGTDWKNIWAKIGSGTLNTSATNLVAAINEVKVTADAGGGGSAPAASTTVAGISERATDAEALALSATDVTLSPGNLGAITNVANGILKLDGSAKVASTYLPSYVDDVLEYANTAAFPGTGSTGIVYVAIDTLKIYRWSGSAYVEISASPGSTDAVTEGSTNLYFTNSRADTRADGRITARIGDETTDLSALYTTAKA
jgi:hypothetical protein